MLSSITNKKRKGIKMSKKTDLITDVVRNITLLSDVYHRLVFLRDVYLDEGFDGAGADYILTSDIIAAGYDFTAAELEDCVDTLSNSLNKFMQGQASATVDYEKKMNLVLKLVS